jgi:hypothetical protein
MPLRGGEAFLERLLVEREQRGALLDLGAFREKNLLHERLDARAHLDILGRIQCPMISVWMGALVAATSITCTTGGGGGAATSFLQPHMPSTVMAASRAGATGDHGSVEWFDDSSYLFSPN